MAYLFGLLVLVILFTVLHFFTEISFKQKVITVSIFALFILGAYLFNVNTQERRLHLENVLLEYTHGEQISCAGIDVNKEVFSYSSGTQTFLGIKDTKMYGRIISLDKCE